MENNGADQGFNNSYQNMGNMNMENMMGNSMGMGNGNNLNMGMNQMDNININIGQ